MIDLKKLRNSTGHVLAIVNTKTGEYEPVIKDVALITRCKDCKWGREVCGNIECCCDMNVPPEYHGYDWYCPNGERKEE